MDLPVRLLVGVHVHRVHGGAAERRGHDDLGLLVLERDQLVDEQWATGKEVLGTITLIYDHHQAGLSDKLNDLQHEYHANVLASTHVHLDHGTCAEMIMIRGKPDVLRALTDGMRRLKGVMHAAFAASATGKLTR